MVDIEPLRVWSGEMSGAMIVFCAFRLTRFQALYALGSRSVPGVVQNEIEYVASAGHWYGWNGSVLLGLIRMSCDQSRVAPSAT